MNTLGNVKGIIQSRLPGRLLSFFILVLLTWSTIYHPIVARAHDLDLDYCSVTSSKRTRVWSSATSKGTRLFLNVHIWLL